MAPRSATRIEAAKGRRSPVGDDHARGAIAVVPKPAQSTMLVFSRDASVLDLASRATGDGWKLERCDDVRKCRESLVRPQLRLVIVDDEAIEDHLRGWLLERLRTWAPQAPFVYVAGDHSDTCEKRARAYAAGYYTSKPLEPDSLLRVIASFIGLADGKAAAKDRS